MKIKNNIIIDGTIQYEGGGSSTEYFATDGTRQNINVSFVTDEASLPGTGVADTLYIAKAENTLHEWNGSSYDSLGGGSGSTNVVFVANVSGLPPTGEVDTLYVAKSDNTLHEWNGSSYDALGKTSLMHKSDDVDNNIVLGTDNKLYFKDDHDAAYILKTILPKGKYVENVANDYSDIGTKLDGFVNDSIFYIETVGGSARIAVRVADFTDIALTGRNVTVIARAVKNTTPVIANAFYKFNNLGIHNTVQGYEIYKWNSASSNTNLDQFIDGEECYFSVMDSIESTGGAAPEAVDVTRFENIGDATAWKNGYFLNNIAADFSDFVSRADAVGDKDIFIFKRTNGTWGFASKDSSFYSPKYLLLAATMSSDGTTANADPTKFIRFTDVAFSPYGRYGTYTAYVQNYVGDLGTTEGNCMVFPIPTGFSQQYEGEIVFYGSVGAFPTTGDTRVLYVSTGDDTIHRWNGAAYVPISGGGGGGLTEDDVKNTERLYTKQQNHTQGVLTDASTLAWDLSTDQSAVLTATSAVGNSRTLPNSILSAAAEGGNYQLIFKQDATGGRDILFDTSFVAVGSFDLRASELTVVSMVVQGGIGYVSINAFDGIVSGLSNAGGGTPLLTGETIKSLIGGAHTTLTDNGNDVTIDSDIDNAAGTGSILLNGSLIKRLKAGTNVTFGETADDITINAAAGGGGSAFRKNFVYVDNVTGNDGTGALNDPTLPFLTITAAQNALPAFVSGTPDFWTICITSRGTYTFPSTIPNRNIRYYSDQVVTLTAASVTRAANAGGVYTHMSFDIRHGTFQITSQGTNVINSTGSSLSFYAQKVLMEGTTTSTGGGFYRVSGQVDVHVYWVRSQSYFLWTGGATGGNPDSSWSDSRSNTAKVWIGVLDCDYTSRPTFRAAVTLGKNTNSDTRHELTICYGIVTTSALFFTNDANVRLGSVDIKSGWVAGDRPRIGWLESASSLEFVNSKITNNATNRFCLLDVQSTSTVRGYVYEATVNYDGTNYVDFIRTDLQACIENLTIRKLTFTGTVGTGGSTSSRAAICITDSGDLSFNPVGTNISNLVIEEIVNANGIIFDEGQHVDDAKSIVMTGHNYIHTQGSFKVATSTLATGDHTINLRGRLRGTGALANGVVVSSPAFNTDF
jgi:hypothetical protein